MGAVWRVGAAGLGSVGRFVRRHFNFTGLVTAVVFTCWSLTPSLVPRSWLVQAWVAGISAASGYGVGVFASHLVRRIVRREPSARVKRLAWNQLAVGGPLLVATFLFLAAHWQEELRVRLQVPAEPGFSYTATAVLTLVVMMGLLSSARLLRWLTRRIARPLHRLVPARVANPLAALVVALFAIGLLDGIVLRAFFGAADGVARTVDALLTEDVARPATTTRSGGPGSFLAWEDLGSKGRDFVGGGPAVAELAAFNGGQAREPVRVYAGLRAAEDDRNRAVVAVDELERAGGFERAVLAVVVPTGTGWVNPIAADALEYLHSGDTAIVAMQYSYIPSWLSYLVDRGRAREAGRVLFDEVHDRWSELPEDARPLLVVYGESLGSHGSEGAFGGVADLRARVDGALWVGPPNFNVLWQDFTGQRDPGTLERLPTFEQGRTVRFAASPDDLLRPTPVWDAPRVVYLQNASDPVVWWSPGLIFRQPDWLREPRGDDVLPQVRWFPLVTFTQMTFDLLYDYTLQPDGDGHGHSYGAVIGDAWSAIVPPDGWTDEDAAALRELLRRHPSIAVPDPEPREAPLALTR